MSKRIQNGNPMFFAVLFLLFILPGFLQPKMPDPPPPVVDPLPGQWYGFCYPSQLSYDANIWSNALVKGSKWDLNVYRVPFLFSSFSHNIPTLLSKLDAIVNTIGASGGKVILDFHCLSQYNTTPDLIGNPSWLSDWLLVANHFSGNQYVIGVELANEPFSASRYTGYTTNTQIAGLLTNLANSIHAIKPGWYIVLPPPNFIKISEYPQSLKGLNSVMTIHPYSYGSKGTWTELKAIADYRFGAQIEGWDTVFDRVWLGELDCHPASAGGAQTLELEMQYVVYCINKSIQMGFGFNYWKYNYNTDDGGANQDTVIQAATGWTPK